MVVPSFSTSRARNSNQNGGFKRKHTFPVYKAPRQESSDCFGKLYGSYLKIYFYFPAFVCFETFNLQMNMLFSTFYKQFVGVKGVGKHRLARSMLGIHADFSVQM